VRVAVCGVELLSETWIVNMYALDEVGAPEIVPVVAARVRPGGREPEPDAMPHVYGAWPLFAAKVAEYGTETWAPGREFVVITRVFDGAVVDTAMFNAWVALWSGEEESTTFAVKLKLPDWVGVPEILPADVVKVRPAGSLPEAMLQV
jgi:hypothetical protein